MGCIRHDAPAGPRQWKAYDHLPEPRVKGAAVAVGSRIYYVGGLTGQNGADPAHTQKTSDRVDVLDVPSRQWSAGPSLPAGAPRHHLAITVYAGNIYILGGYVGSHADASGITPVATSYVLDVAGGAWRRLADQPIARSGAAAEAIGDTIFVAGGGTDELTGVADLYAYDPRGDTWSKRRAMTSPRTHVASCAAGGKLYVIGGWIRTPNDVATTAAGEVYDPAADTWESLPDMPTARGAASAVAIDDVCYVTGGFRWSGPAAAYAVTEGLAIGARTWSVYAPMIQTRQGMGVARVDDAVYVLGGSPVPGDGYTDAIDVFSR